MARALLFRPAQDVSILHITDTNEGKKENLTQTCLYCSGENDKNYEKQILSKILTYLHENCICSKSELCISAVMEMVE